MSTKAADARNATRRLRRTGLIALTVIVLATVALFNKNHIVTVVDSGKTIQVHFAGDYKLRPYVSKVKVGFVPVGRVSGVHRAADGSAVVSVKVSDEAVRALGSEPSATIRPTTVLGGSYFVDLEPGGDHGAFSGTTIPRDRTSAPVELGQVVQALQPDALKGLQHSVGNLRDSLGPQGRTALVRLLRTTPGTLRPASTALAAAQGTRPGQDLPRLVTGFDTTARALTARPGQLERIVADLRTTSAALASRSPSVSAALRVLPQTLDNTRTGLAGLSSTLTTLRAVSGETRPAVQELGRTLSALSPVLSRARPVIHDLRYVARDARPVLANLVPISQQGRRVVDEVRGPVIRRVNGPVLRWLYAPYHGTGMYSKTRSSRPMYQETTFALVDVDRASALVDGNGNAIAFQPGLGTGSVGGFPISLSQFVKLTDLWSYPSLARQSGLPPIGKGLTSLLDILGGK